MLTVMMAIMMYFKISNNKNDQLKHCQSDFFSSSLLYVLTLGTSSLSPVLSLFFLSFSLSDLPTSLSSSLSVV